MSLIITTDVQCDGEGCLLWTDGATGPHIAPNEARRAAKAEGWTYRVGRDYCPKHSRELESSE